ncbi:MAG: hypothetical protein A2V70_01930 [Planctomycetes bacterium RBG_13_63_9]|nr:MAG: hypothetical protein A2V70_01930 [Planctomycetes bacterium RBG_13_63_9]
MLLVVPGAAVTNPAGTSFYAVNDISVRFEGGVPKANGLADLCRRECRFGHDPRANFFPFDARGWGQLGLPTLRECSHRNWSADTVLPTANCRDVLQIDLWREPHPWSGVEQATGAIQVGVGPPLPPAYLGTRVAEDVILTNVLGFDVKVWDPGAPVLLSTTTGEALVPGDPEYLPVLQDVAAGRAAPIGYGAYVDLNYMCLVGNDGSGDPDYPVTAGTPAPLFHSAGRRLSALRGTEPFAKDFTDEDVRPALKGSGQDACVYDTWSLHYESDGQNEDNDKYPNGTIRANAADPQHLTDEGTNGFDDDTDPNSDGYGIVDDPGERETSPPYPAPLTAIQVKIRVFEPDSRQIREVTIVQDFLPK